MTFEEQRDLMDSFDELIEDGYYVVPNYSDDPVYDFAGFRAYCKEKGIKSSEATQEEVEMFAIND